MIPILLCLVFGFSDAQIISPILPGINNGQINSSQCHLKPADIIFVLDDSGSVGYTNFQKVKEFVKAFVREFDIGPLNVQIGVTLYSTLVNEYINLNTYWDKASLINGISRLPYQSGTTHTGDALMVALKDAFIPRHGDRDSVTNVLMVITDGQSQNARQTAAAAAEVHKAGIKTFAIGVGNGVKQSEMQAIASDNNHVFHVQNFDALQQLKEELRNRTCEAIAYSNLYCQNNILNCKAYGHVVCVNYAQWGRQNCPLYCGYCAAQGTPPPPTDSTTTASTTTTPTTTTKTTTTTTQAPTPPPLQSKGECKNVFGNCQGYGTSVCKNYREWAIQNCAQFCGFCHGPPTPPPLTTSTFKTPAPPCEDKLGNCAAYGADSCRFYQKWAELNCPKTCGICTSGLGFSTPALPTTTVTTTTKFHVDGECIDHLGKGSCESYGPDMCYKYREWAAKQCPKFCLFCEPPTSPAPSTTEPPCINKDPDCESRGPIVCFQNQTWAEQNCREFCLFCTTPSPVATSPMTQPIFPSSPTSSMFSSTVPTSEPPSSSGKTSTATTQSPGTNPTIIVIG